MADKADSIASLLIEARTQIDQKKAISVLHNAENICRAMIKDKDRSGYSMLSEILSEMARECEIPSKRYELWNSCLSTLISGSEKFQDYEFAVMLGSKTADFLQDYFIDIPITELNATLARVKRNIDNFLDKIPPHPVISRLLARKSSVLRNMARFLVSKQAQINTSQKSLRCAEKAVSEDSSSWDANLELALSLWHIAQYEKKGKNFNSLLQRAEEYFWKSIAISPNVYNLLALSRYFRFTYQTVPCLECFNRYEEIEYNKRRLLQTAYLYSEAVVQLWYADYPKSILDHYLNEADGLLETASHAGFRDARQIIDHAFIKAIKKDIALSEDIFHALHSLPSKASWTALAEAVLNSKSPDDLVRQGIALGMGESSSWNKLGTFFYTFYRDLNLAIYMHRVALRLNSNNAVAMTNLAKRLLEIGSAEALIESNTWIDKAASCADRRFRWWREVRDQVKTKFRSIHPAQIERKQVVKPKRFNKLSELYSAYKYLESIENHQERGYDFEKLINRLFNISLGNSFSAYRTSLQWGSGLRGQVDAAFIFFDPSIYRVEIKWTTDPIRPDAITLFREKLNVAEVKGLFISVSGFTNEAISTARYYCAERQIILMDGEELELILQGYIALDEVIRLKQIHLGVETNPYFKIKPIIQTEITA